MLLLREAEGRHRLLPIYIGNPEASAIHYALEGVVPPTAADARSVPDHRSRELGATITQVVVTEIRDRTYYAELHLATSTR